MNLQQQELFLYGEINIRKPQGWAIVKSPITPYEWRIYDREDRMIGGFAYVDKAWIRLCHRAVDEFSAKSWNPPLVEDTERARHITNEAIGALNNHGREKASTEKRRKDNATDSSIVHVLQSTVQKSR
jgi:hypothetical protein